MHRKTVLAGLAALAAIATAAVAATAVFGGGSPSRPDYATVEIEMQRTDAPAARAAAAKKAKKPTVIYLQGQTTTVNVAETGPYVDVRLFSCPGNSRVIEGGVFPVNTGLYQQGSYIPSKKEYHVLIGFETGMTPVNFELSSHLTCLKGVK